MISNRFRVTAFALAFTGALAFPAFAQTGNPPAPGADNDRLDSAWEDLLEDEGGLLTSQQYAALNNLAFQAAVGRVCDGQELDADKFGKAITEILLGTDTELSDEEHEQRNTAVLLAFGTRYGLFLGEANGDNKPDFCATGDKLKALKDGPPVFLK